MTKPRIIHIAEDLRTGGLERVVASIATCLDKTRYHVEVWALVAGGEVAEELSDSGIIVKILGLKTYHNPLNLFKLAVLLRKHRADIVHTHGYYGSTFGRLAAIGARIPVILAHIHTSHADFKRRHLFIERMLSLFTDKIICVSEAVRNYVVDNERISAKKVAVIYNGAGKAFCAETEPPSSIDRTSLNWTHDDIVVVTVASITRHKGHRVLIDAIFRLSGIHKNLRLLLVGDGPLRKELASYVAALGLSGKIVFAGQARDVRPYLRLSDIFVLPSTEREGLGVALIEAMAQGLPLVGTRLGGIPEVIEGNANGFLVPPNNIEELACAIERLMTGKDMNRRMGQMGRKIFEKKFTLEIMMAKMERLYKRALGQPA